MTDAPIDRFLKALHARLGKITGGKVADYIPELTKSKPEWFGICIATRDGHVYEVGDSLQPFTIQSISKPFTYGLILQEEGEAAVLKRIGVEPSGDAFNAISLKPGSGCPMNPMINAGAIAACGMVKGSDSKEKFELIRSTLSKHAGRELDVDMDVYNSESSTGHRNRAIGWILRNFDILQAEPTPVLETYFQQCSIRVTCRDLSLMAATLANNGINPITGVRAIASDCVPKVLSVMSTCGMYDGSGEWVYQVGLPAKSGVGGGIIAVLPGQLGIGVFSPPLDEWGNSLRGIAVCRELSRELGLHLLAVTSPPSTSIRRRFDRRTVSSKRRRRRDEDEYLRSVGDRIRGFHVQGMLSFGMAEPILREIMEVSESADFFIVNLRSVLGMDSFIADYFAQTRRQLLDRGKLLLFTESSGVRPILSAAGIESGALFQDDDFALEFCEESLLKKIAAATGSYDESVPLDQCDLLLGLTPDELRRMDSLMETRRYKPSDPIIRAGDIATELFVLTQGLATVVLPKEKGQVRLDVFATGMTFGEVAFLDQARRTADVLASSEVVCRVLTRAQYEKIGAEAPLIRIKILENIARGLSASLRRANLQIESRA